MWIAKNSVTGKTYGDRFESIYDCQAFIDDNLKLLEYEMRRAFSMEEEILRDIEINKRSKGLASEINLRFQFGINDLYNGYTSEQLKTIVQECFLKKKNERNIDEALTKLAKTNWLKNNIIRCWYIEQKRFADGFDF